MKSAIVRFLFVLIFCTVTKFAAAGDFVSVVLSAGQQLPSGPITVPPDRFLVIRNFTQDGGMNRGTVTAMTNQMSSTVLTAALTTTAPVPPEVINNVVVAGPSQVTITCGSDATTCFVTYRKGTD